VDGQPWAAGIFQGYVPANELLNVSAGYRINNYVRIHATATNLLDQQRFQLFGGSVIGRRVLGGVTANFSADVGGRVCYPERSEGDHADMVPFAALRVTVRRSAAERAVIPSAPRGILPASFRTSGQDPSLRSG
jgi:hypothetical protein